MHHLDARAKFFGFLILIAAVIVTNSAVGGAILILLISLLLRLTHLPPGIVIGPVFRLSVFFVMIFLMNALFFQTETCIWRWWIFSLSVDGAVQGIRVVFRLLLIMLMSNIFTLTTPPLEITSAIQTLLRPLNLLRIPADEISMILSVAIQFIPTLLEETNTIKNAQIARGARFESRKLRERATAMLPLIIPVFLSAFKRADELAMAMEARGYRGAKYRSRKKEQRMPANAWLALLLCAVICAAEIILG